MITEVALFQLVSAIFSALARRDYRRARLEAENLVIHLAAIEERRQASKGAKR